MQIMGASLKRSGMLTLIWAALGCAPELAPPSAPTPPSSLASLLEFNQQEVAALDIARMNLLCSEGLTLTSRIPLEMEKGRWEEAAHCFGASAKLAPKVASYHRMIDYCRKHEGNRKTSIAMRENS